MGKQSGREGGGTKWVQKNIINQLVMSLGYLSKISQETTFTNHLHVLRRLLNHKYQKVRPYLSYSDEIRMVGGISDEVCLYSPGVLNKSGPHDLHIYK